KFGRALCQLWLAVDYTASTASILNLLILSLDRYWSVSSPLLYLHQRTKTRARIMIFLVWLASALWIIPILGWHAFANGGVYNIPESQCDPEYKENFPLKIVTGLLNFYIPLSIMYVLYGRIFKEIRKRTHLEEKFHSAYQQSAATTAPTANGKTSSRHLGAAPISNCRGTESASTPAQRPDSAAASVRRCHTEFIYDEAIIDCQTERIRPLLVRAPCTSLRYTCARCFPPDPPPPPPPPTLVSNDAMVRETTAAEAVAMAPTTTTAAANSAQDNSESSFKRSSSLKKDIKAVRQLGVIMGAFTACFLPYFVIFVVVAFCHDCISSDLMLALTWVGYANSTLNPALYPLCNQTFRRKFRSMLGLQDGLPAAPHVAARHGASQPRIKPRR
uniref:Histamine H1 receptor n=1 Tax=Macrostomum lignano TaxID=282301 RepID=A0A1I8H4H3_9PLAT